MGGLIFGQPPKVTSNDFGPAVLTATSNLREDSDTSFHLEGLYRYQVNNNISITPGLIVIFNPEQNSNNDTIYTGVVRTTALLWGLFHWTFNPGQRAGMIE